jgi:hypothetical protein
MSGGSDPKLSLMINDDIDQCVGHLLGLYKGALEQGNANWRVVRHGLSIVLGELKLNSPTHPAVDRLSEFIATNDARDATRPLKTH